MEFEKAEMVRKKIEYIENYQSKSVVVTPELGDVDVFSILKENDIGICKLLDGAKWNNYSDQDH